MEDDKIKNLFNDFQPELSSSRDFMSRLQKNMTMVEFFKRQNTALKKRNRIAIAIAAVSGFIMGGVMTLLFSLIENWTPTIMLPTVDLKIQSMAFDYSILAWIVMAGVCLITSLNAYEIALAKLTPKERTL